MDYTEEFIPGEYVTYTTAMNQIIKGRVVSENDHGNIYVVFNCNDDWERYTEYTAQLISRNRLQHGWIKPVIKVRFKFLDVK